MSAAAVPSGQRPTQATTVSPGIQMHSAATGAGSGAPAAGASTATPGGVSTPRTAVNFTTVAWKSESEETVKTRKNALRVIINKFRNFFPTEGEEQLTKKAALLERTVFDVTSSKVAAVPLVLGALRYILWCQAEL
jgi:hypothetical protein